MSLQRRLQPGQDRPASPVGFGPGDLTPEHRDLMTEHHDLGVLGRLAAPQQHPPAEDPDHQVEQAKGHKPRSCRNQSIGPSRSSRACGEFRSCTGSSSRRSCAGGRAGRSGAGSGPGAGDLGKVVLVEGGRAQLTAFMRRPGASGAELHGPALPAQCHSRDVGMRWQGRRRHHGAGPCER